MQPITIAMLLGAVLLLASIVASNAASRFGIPSLLLFLVIGMAAGSDGPGGIWFDDFETAQAIGIVALAFILYSGGLDTPWQAVRDVVKPASVLATVGVGISALIVGGAAHLLLGFGLMEGILLGAIIGSTDAAAVFATLRSRGISLKGQLQPLIELESGSNDPMAVFLTSAIIARLQAPDTPVFTFFTSFAMQMAVGAMAGLAFGRLAVWSINKVRLEYDGLYPVMSIGFVLLTYAGTDALKGNGFLAVYIAGLVVGNSRVLHRRSIQRFHDGIAWLAQITMFLALGLLVFPRQLPGVAAVGIAVAVVGTLVARPVSVFVSLAASRFSARDKLFISWAGLRGAVPIILATFAMTAKLPGAQTIFNIVFFSVVVSVLIQGTTLPRAARLLGVQADALPLTDAITRRSDLLTIDVPSGSPSAGRRLVEISLPADVLVLLVYRGDVFFPATGSTRIDAGDRLMVFASKESVDEARALLHG